MSSKTFLRIATNWLTIAEEYISLNMETDFNRIVCIIQNETCDNIDIIKSTCIEPKSLRKVEMVFNVIDINQILQCILYKNFIPIELIKIVETYYGDHGSVERLMYHILAKLIYKLHFNSHYKKPLPYSNYSNSSFTDWLRYEYKIYTSYTETLENIKEAPFCVLSPNLFYKYFKEVNNLGDDFVIPVMNEVEMIYPFKPPYKITQFSTFPNVLKMTRLLI